MPLWVGLAVSTGLGIWGAKKQADAADKAVTQQTQSADKGLALQEKIYNQQVAGMQPYAQFGQHALGSLGELMGFPASASQAPNPLANATGYDAQGQPLGPFHANNPPMNMSDPRVQFLANGGSLADLPPGGGMPGDGSIGSMIGQSGYGNRGANPSGEFVGVAKRPRPGTFAVV